MSSSSLRLGTRGSQLALYQARTVARLIREAGGPDSEIVVIKTSGDRLQEAPLSEAGGKRLFVKELEDALLAGTIDFAVHSSKDMPSVLPEGLTIAGVLPREDPRDAVVLPAGRPSPESLDELKTMLGATPTIGTSSVRRIAEMRRLWPEAQFVAIRGNLDTRLRKLDAGGYDCLVLAAAGLRRLEFADRISLAIDPDAATPAPGQGVIAVEIRAGDETTRRAVAPITEPNAWAALAAERAVVERLGGGCQTPIGALTLPLGGGRLRLTASVLTLDGRRIVRATAEGSEADPRALGTTVAEQLIADGAMEILDEVRRLQDAPPTQ